LNYVGLVRCEYIAAIALVVITFIILYLTLHFIRREKEHTETLYTGLGMIFGAVLGIPIGDALCLELTWGMVLGAIIGAIIGRLLDRYVNKSSCN